jgi:hypothetical protein
MGPQKPDSTERIPEKNLLAEKTFLYDGDKPTENKSFIKPH